MLLVVVVLPRYINFLFICYYSYYRCCTTVVVTITLAVGQLLFRESYLRCAYFSEEAVAEVEVADDEPLRSHVAVPTQKEIEQMIVDAKKKVMLL